MVLFEEIPSDYRCTSVFGNGLPAVTRPSLCKNARNNLCAQISILVLVCVLWFRAIGVSVLDGSNCCAISRLETCI